MTKNSFETLRVAEIDQDDVFCDMVRVAHKHRSFSSAGQVIRVCTGNKCIPMVARGARGNVQGVIFMDLRTRGRLGLKPNVEAEFTFKKAHIWHQFWWAWTATDAMPRIAARLGLISVGLGVVGLGLGVISLIPKPC